MGSGTLNGEAHGFLLTPIDTGAPQPPSIVGQPAGGQFALGGSVTLKVTAVGTSPFTYAWSKDNMLLTNATSDTLNLPSLRGTDSGIYRVVITNSAGSATSKDATVAVLDPLLSAAKYTVVQLTGEVGGRHRLEATQHVDAHPFDPALSGRGIRDQRVPALSIESAPLKTVSARG